jgi:hypothetical protein
MIEESPLAKMYRQKVSTYKGWEIVYTRGINGGATASKHGVRTELFWEPSALEHLKKYLDGIER